MQCFARRRPRTAPLLSAPLSAAIKKFKKSHMRVFFRFLQYCGAPQEYIKSYNLRKKHEGKETAAAMRTSEEDIIARNSEVEASKKLNKHKLVAVAMERNATMLASKIERKLSTIKKRNV